MSSKLRVFQVERQNMNRRLTTESGAVLLIQETFPETNFLQKYMSGYGEYKPIPESELLTLLEALKEITNSDDPSIYFDIFFLIIDYSLQRPEFNEILHEMVVIALIEIRENAKEHLSMDSEVNSRIRYNIIRKFLNQIGQKIDPKRDELVLIHFGRMLMELTINQEFKLMISQSKYFYYVLNAMELLSVNALIIWLNYLIEILDWNTEETHQIAYIFTWSNQNHKNIWSLLIGFFTKNKQPEIRTKIFIAWKLLKKLKVLHSTCSVLNFYNFVDQSLTKDEELVAVDIEMYLSMKIDDYWSTLTDDDSNRWTRDYCKMKKDFIRNEIDAIETRKIDDFYKKIRSIKIQPLLKYEKELKKLDLTSNHQFLTEQRKRQLSGIDCSKMWPPESDPFHQHLTFDRRGMNTVIFNQIYSVAINQGEGKNFE